MMNVFFQITGEQVGSLTKGAGQLVSLWKKIVLDPYLIPSTQTNPWFKKQLKEHTQEFKNSSINWLYKKSTIK